jgi:hypothetical protein
VVSVYHNILRFVYKHVFILLIVWALLILSLCAIPGQFIPSTSWLEMLSFDKFVHASIFFILVSLWIVYVFRFERPSLYLIAGVVLAILYGGSIEWMQANLFTQRSADWYDFYANSFGCLMAWISRGFIQKQIRYTTR